MYLQSLKQVKETSKPLPKRRNAFDNYRKSYSNYSQSLHDVKQARIRVFSDSYYSRICLRLCSYTGKYGSEKTLILAYFTQR